MEPYQIPCSRFILVYRRYGPKYSPLTGAGLYIAIPAFGSGVSGGAPNWPNPGVGGIESYGLCFIGKPGENGGGNPGVAGGPKPGVPGGNPGDWIDAI
jgi:hypothetical protein